MFLVLKGLSVSMEKQLIVSKRAIVEESHTEVYKYNYHKLY